MHHHEKDHRYAVDGVAVIFGTARNLQPVAVGFDFHFLGEQELPRFVSAASLLLLMLLPSSTEVSVPYLNYLHYFGTHHLMLSPTGALDSYFDSLETALVAAVLISTEYCEVVVLK